MKYRMCGLICALLTFSFLHPALAVPGPAQLGRGAEDLAYRCVGREGPLSYEREVDYCTQVMHSTVYHGFAWPYLARAIAYSHLGKFDLALADLDAAVQLVTEKDSDKPTIYSQRCLMRVLNGKPLDQALSDCNEALSIQSDDFDTLDVRAYVEYKSGQYKEALTDYNAIAAGATLSQNSLHIRGLLKLKLGDADGGNADIATAAAMPKMDPSKYAGYNLAP